MALPRVVDVEHLGERSLKVTFSDGLVRELDFSAALPGVLAILDDDVTFSLVEVDEVSGTVAWPGGYDLDPDVLHGGRQPASLPAPRLIREYRLQEAG